MAKLSNDPRSNFVTQLEFQDGSFEYRDGLHFRGIRHADGTRPVYITVNATCSERTKADLKTNMSDLFNICNILSAGNSAVRIQYRPYWLHKIMTNIKGH